MPARLQLTASQADLGNADTLLLIGRAAQLLSDRALALVPSSVPEAVFRDMVKRADPGDFGRVSVTHTGSQPRRVAAGVLPEHASRHNTPSRALCIPGIIQGSGLKGSVAIVAVLEAAEHAFAAALAIARAHPTFAAQSKRIERSVKVMLLGPDGPIEDLSRLETAMRATRYAAELVDRPPNVLGPAAMVMEAQGVAERTGAHIEVIAGEDLVKAGLGGIYGVGKAAVEPPALVILDHGTGNRGTTWVGKGITYDTGGLSIKSKVGMPGMKNDMAGAAAVLAAFEAAVTLGAGRLTAILCVAENAINANATRPDDVLHMYSGRTVEVNNTDAEGRLVLADGVAWAVKNRKPTQLIDVATLTGAQAIATGRRIAALYANNEELETRAVRAGRASGDLCHPLPYAPELFRREFSSSIADMKNSVKNRNNAQSSCAGQFIANHLGPYKGAWLHVDMAGPSMIGPRASGYGVGLLLTLAGLGAPTN
jgi:probable aminopeptidase NPEPL1